MSEPTIPVADALNAAQHEPWGTRPREMTDNEWLIVAYERICLNVSRGLGGDLACVHYGQLRRELLRRMAAAAQKEMT